MPGLAEIFVAYDQGAQSVDFAIRHSGYGPLPLLPGVDCASGNWCKAFDAEGKGPAGERPPSYSCTKKKLVRAT